MIKKIIKVINNPRLIFVHLGWHKPFSSISDEKYNKYCYRAYTGRELNLDDPKTFDEKIQWLILYDRRPEYTDLTDKYKVRSFVADRIGEEHLIPLLGCWDRPEEIPYDELPNQFVLKCNHDSGSVIICTDKNTFDREKANKQLKKQLKQDYYVFSREYNYHGIERKIIAEKYMRDAANGWLTDYKFFCFDGEPKFIQVDTDRFENHIRNFYTTDWEFIDVQCAEPNDPNHLAEKPLALQEMLEIARKLSNGFPHVRVDLYYSEGKIYFGEMTFHHMGGCGRFKPHYYNELWGSYLTLPRKYTED